MPALCPLAIVLWPSRLDARPQHNLTDAIVIVVLSPLAVAQAQSSGSRLPSEARYNNMYSYEYGDIVDNINMESACGTSQCCFGGLSNCLAFATSLRHREEKSQESLPFIRFLDLGRMQTTIRPRGTWDMLGPGVWSRVLQSGTLLSCRTRGRPQWEGDARR